MPKFYRSDVACGNGPFSLPGGVDVCFQPGAQLQSGGRPLRRLLEPDQHQVSDRAADRFTAQSPRCSVSASPGVRYAGFA